LNNRLKLIIVQEGIKAYAYGKSIEVNPYINGTDEAKEWEFAYKYERDYKPLLEMRGRMR
jgi:hypothetical protein